MSEELFTKILQIDKWIFHEKTEHLFFEFDTAYKVLRKFQIFN